MPGRPDDGWYFGQRPDAGQALDNDYRVENQDRIDDDAEERGAIQVTCDRREGRLEAVNITLGVLGIAVAMASAAIGVFMVAARRLERVQLCAWLVLGGAALSVFAMERAPHHPGLLGVVCG